MVIGEIAYVTTLKISCTSSFSSKALYNLYLGFYCILLWDGIFRRA